MQITLGNCSPFSTMGREDTLQAIAAKEVDLRLAHLTLRHDLRQVLTPEQQKKFRTMAKHHHARDEGEHR